MTFGENLQAHWWLLRSIVGYYYYIFVVQCQFLHVISVIDNYFSPPKLTFTHGIVSQTHETPLVAPNQLSQVAGTHCYLKNEKRHFSVFSGKSGDDELVRTYRARTPKSRQQGRLVWV